MESTIVKEVLTPKDVMNLLGISRSTLQRLKKKGTLIGYKFSNKVYFKRSEILAAIEAGKEVVAVQEAA
ncbi:MAG: helix-turn-helix domain-containing protein [Bacteroidota bacterium]